MIPCIVDLMVFVFHAISHHLTCGSVLWVTCFLPILCVCHKSQDYQILVLCHLWRSCVSHLPHNHLSGHVDLSSYCFLCFLTFLFFSGKSHEFKFWTSHDLCHSCVLPNSHLICPIAVSVCFNDVMGWAETINTYEDGFARFFPFHVFPILLSSCP